MPAVENMALFPDPATETFLLPGHLIQCTNRDEVACYKIALRMAMANFLTPAQRDLMRRRYWERQSVTAIAQAEGVTPSAISKRIHAAENVLRTQISYCHKVYTTIKKIGGQENA